MQAFNFRNLKLFSLIFLELFKRNRIKIIFVLVVIVIVILGQFKFKIFYDSNVVSLGFIGTYQEHDLPKEVLRLLSKGLVVDGLDGRVSGNLASGWDTNNDATVFKFKLKDNLHWSDNSIIKSTDLSFNIPNIEVSTPDEKTIQFKLKDPYSPLPSLLVKPIFKANSLVGTGPYRITKIEKSRIFITKIYLESIDKTLPKISIRFYPNEKIALTGFSLGEVQAIFGFTDSNAFSNNPRVSLKQKVDYTKIVSILLNNKDTNLSNRSLRQALAFSTPKIEEELEANSPYPPFLWAYNPDSKKYLANKDEAKSAMDRAKSNLPDGKLSSDIILTTTPKLEGLAGHIVNSWKELGISAKVRTEEGIAQNFQALLITQEIPLDPDQYFLWHATQTKTNLTKYDSKRADKDLEDGRKLILEEDRKAKYFDFQKALLEDAPAIFLYFPKYNIAYLKKSEKLLDKILSL